MSILLKFGFTSDSGGSAFAEESQQRKKDGSKQKYEKTKPKCSFYAKRKDKFSWLDFDAEKNLIFMYPVENTLKKKKNQGDLWMRKRILG